MSRFIVLAIIPLVFSLTGCSSTPPVNYHTLLTPSPKTTTSVEPANFLIDVLPVGMPAQLDQSQLIVRHNQSGISVLDGERWNGALSDEFRSALSAGLSSYLNTQDSSGLALSTAKPTLRIKVQVRRFDAWPNQQAQLEADWSLGFANKPNDERLLCNSQLKQSAVGGYAELVQAQQRLVTALATEIALGAQQNQCPNKINKTS